MKPLHEAELRRVTTKHMCLILFAYRHHTDYPLVVAANRDEFYDRPTAPAGFWDDAPDLLAGRDLEARGTWLGVTRQGRFAALTNYRHPEVHRTGAPSRGGLVSGFLLSRESPGRYLERVEAQAEDYNGFNLVAGDDESLWWYSNRSMAPAALRPGLYGISNHLLDTPWPKVRLGKAGLARLLEASAPDVESILALLADRERAVEGELPSTGVGLDLERTLSPMFITSRDYGTRSSTVLLVRADGHVHLTERSYDPQTGDESTVSHEFRIETPEKQAAPAC